MKNIVLLSILISGLLFSYSSSGQISSFPYTEGFESPFTIGVNVDFLPNLNGNEVTTVNRIFQDNSNYHSGLNSCGIIPTSSFDPKIIARLNLTGVNNAYVEFYAATASNPTGNRPALLYMSTSSDSGNTYSNPVMIGDSSSFPNANTGWNLYQYSIPYTAYNKPNVFIKFAFTRGDGTGTTAKVMLDDLQFNYAANDTVRPLVYGVKTISSTNVVIAFSEPTDASAENVSNYTISTGVSNAVRTTAHDSVILTLSSPLVVGQWYPLQIQNVSDQSGNAMNPPQTFDVVFNDNTGDVKITEIMYNNPGADSLSFIEIKNMENFPINIGGWYFSSGLGNFVFPSNLIITPHDYLVFSRYPSLVDPFFSIQSIYYGIGNLSNTDEKIAISNTNDVLIDSVHYYSTLPWDTTANGYGTSLVLCNESSNNDLASNWTAATTPKGSYSNYTIYANPMTDCALVAGVNEINENADEITILPNPGGQDRLITFTASENENCPIEIFDMIGNLVYKSNYQFSKGKNNISLRLPDLHCGIYLIKCNHFSTKRLIIDTK